MTKPFRWGRFSEFVDAGIVEDRNLAQDDNGAFRFTAKQLSGDEGSGRLLYVDAPDIRVLVADCSFQGDRQYEVYDDGLFRFHFGFDVSIETWLGDSGLPEIAENAAGVLMASPDELMKERVPGGRHQSFVTIACRPVWLEDFFGVRIQDHLTQPDEDYVHHPLNFTANLRGATQAILNRRAAARLDAAFITTKAQEIILATVDGVAQTRRLERQRLTSTDIAAIRSARMLLEESLHAPPDIRTLSRRIGINRTKLFYGFKRLYGTSTVQFIDGLRMNKARRLLLETDMSVSQVAAEVGYGFAANFSTRFKNHFGQSPRTLRREQP